MISEKVVAVICLAVDIDGRGLFLIERTVGHNDW